METRELKSSSQARLFVEYEYTQSKAEKKTYLTIYMYVEPVGAYNTIGPWGDYGGSYLHNDSFDGGIPNISSKTLLHVSHGEFSHDSQGKCTATIGWRWGVRSSWGGFWEDTGVISIVFPQIDVSPSISLSETHTATTITAKASVNNGVSAEKYRFTCNGVTKEVTSNQVTFDNLTPSTTYTIKASAYGNGSWGAESSISTKTNQQNTISNIGDFTLDGVTLTITGNPNDKSTIKVLVNGQVIITRTNVSVGTYNLELTQAEKDTIYSLIGDNSSLASVIRIETGSASVDYNKSITLTGDVFSCYVNVNGVVKRGKVWVGTPQGNKQGIFTIGTSKGNVRGR